VPAGGASGHRGSAPRLDRVRRGDGQPTDRASGSGSSRTRPDRVLADKAYSSVAIRTALRARGIKATIPSKANEITGRAHRGSKGGRPPAFDKAAYKTRNVVERTITSSARLEPSRPDTTKGSSSTAAPSTSPRSGSGCETRPKRIHGTRPNSSSHLTNHNVAIEFITWVVFRLLEVQRES